MRGEETTARKTETPASATAAEAALEGSTAMVSKPRLASSTALPPR